MTLFSGVVASVIGRSHVNKIEIIIISWKLIQIQNGKHGSTQKDVLYKMVLY